jgi:hypothetical protein
MQSPTRELIDLRLASVGGLERLVRDRRAAKVSWRKIEIEIRDRTGISVTHETLRIWFYDLAVAS